jgi:hypothetical protein
MDERGSRNAAFLFEEAQCGWPLGRAPLLGTLEDMLTFWRRNFVFLILEHPVCKM